MLNFLNRAVGSIFLGLLRIFQGTVVRSVKIEAIRLYVRLIAVARQFSIAVLAILGILLLAAVAFVMVHVGVLILLPVSLETKGWIVLALGCLYGVVSCGCIGLLCSEKTWLRLSKASEMMDELLRK
jgi:hypothetical protein